MTVCRAKFRCATEAASKYSRESATTYTYTFQAVGDSNIPEDKRFARYTPLGTLTITVDNPAVNFELGEDYYLDFTLAGQ